MNAIWVDIFKWIWARDVGCSKTLEISCESRLCTGARIVFRACFLWFECGLRCIIVDFMVLTVVSGDNWLLGQIQGGQLRIG